jgi:hypothetical protein
VLEPFGVVVGGVAVEALTGNVVQSGSISEVIAPCIQLPTVDGLVDIATTVFPSPEPQTQTDMLELVVLRDGRDAPVSFQFIIGDVQMARRSGQTRINAKRYKIDRQRGMIVSRRLGDLTGTPVEVTYSGGKQRVDLISFNPQTGNLTYTMGTEVKRVASLWAGTVPDGDVLIYRVFRWNGGAELSPVALFDGPFRVDRREEQLSEVLAQRRLAAPHRLMIAKRAAAGEPLRIAAPGDSITAMGFGTTLSLLNDAPNGQHRDRLGYFRLYDKMTRALLDVADLGDGNGATYIREGLIWFVIKRIKTLYGGNIEYSNWGIGGTNSSAGVANGLYHQGHPSLLANIRAGKPDIVIYAPGMNELGSTDTYANVRAICEYHLANPSLMILSTPCRPNPYWRDRTEQWRFTCLEILRVARDLRIPCIDTRWLFDSLNYGAMGGWTDYELGEAVYIHHPGKIESDRQGELMSLLLQP